MFLDAVRRLGLARMALVLPPNARVDYSERLQVWGHTASDFTTHTSANRAVDIDAHATYREHEAEPRNGVRVSSAAGIPAIARLARVTTTEET